MKKIQGIDCQDKAKTNKKNQILNKLTQVNQLEWKEAFPFILDFCKSKIKISNNEIEMILNLDDKSLVDTFLYEYSLFDKDNLKFIENYTNQNLNNDNKDFISDLIYFAVDFNLNLDYTKILSLLITDEIDEDLLVLGSLNYIARNIQYFHIKKIIKNLKYIRNNKNYFQNSQILASIILYRITHKKYYLSFVKNLIESDEINLFFLEKLLKEEMFDNKFFAVSELKKIVNIN